MLKALAWAKFCWPGEEWTHASLLKLNTSSKVLCGRHVASSQFYDDKRPKLSKFAVPDAVEVEMLLNERDNIFAQQSAQQCMTRPPFAHIENVEQPSTSVVVHTIEPTAEELIQDRENLSKKNIADMCSTSAELSSQDSVKVETIHLFTSFQEYGANNALNYANKDFIQCVESMATLIHTYLKVNAWRQNIKNNIMAALDIVHNSFLNNCLNHLDKNNNHLKLSTFYICVKRFIIIKNREIDEEEKNKALDRELAILRNK